MLNIHISHITISSYADLQQEKKPVVTEDSSTDFKDQTILIIDEVSDSGDTFMRALAHFKDKGIKHAYTLAPYVKNHTKHHPDFYLKSTDAWIIFPYEIRETTEAFIKMF